MGRGMRSGAGWIAGRLNRSRNAWLGGGGARQEVLESRRLLSTMPLMSPNAVATGAYASDMVAIDWNNDGFQDIVQTNFQANALTIVAGHGDGVFDSPAALDVGAPTIKLAAGNLDGDGRPDIVASVFSYSDDAGGTAVVRLGNGTLSTLPTLGRPRGIAIADFNGDGKQDVAITSWYNGSNSVSIYPGNGAGGFGTRKDTGGSGGASRAIARDFNGDGKVDLVLDGDRFLRGIGDGTFAAPQAINPGGIVATIACADLDGNGRLDLLATHSFNGARTVSVMLGNGDGTFAAPVNYATGASPGTIVISDFTGNGVVDVLVVNSHSVSLLANNGSAVLSSRGELECVMNSSLGAAARFDGDSRDDLFIAAQDNSGELFMPFGGDPMGTILQSTGAGAQGVALADFNRDGRMDMAVANFSANTVGIRINAALGDVYARPDLAATGGPWDILAADFNGDGNTDLAISQWQAGKIGIFTGKGDGTFSARVDYSVFGYPAGMACGDLNDDGWPDLAVARSNASSIAILMNNKDGTFAPAVDLPLAGGAWDLALGDFSGDGRLDIAVPMADLAGSSKLALFIQKSAGGYNSSTVAVGTGLAINAVAAADVNGDGKADLVTANYGGNSLSVLSGNGSGGFSVTTVAVAGMQPYGIAVSDLNRDGAVDAAVACYSRNSIAVFAGNGSGGFAAPDTFSGGIQPVSIAIGDVNRDGASDIATAAYADDGGAVLRSVRSASAPDAVDMVISGTSGVIAASYTVRDPDSDAASVTVEFSRDGGVVWRPATRAATSEPITGLATDPTGTAHIFRWDSAADLAGTSGNVRLRITPRDSINGYAAVSSAFRVSNSGSTAGSKASSITLTSAGVAENSQLGTVVGALGANVAGVSFNLPSNAKYPDNALFAISGTELRTATSLDFERKTPYKVYIEASNSAGTIGKLFSVKVINANEVPTDLLLSAATIAENKPAGAVVGTLTGKDPDRGEKLTFALVPGAGGDDNALFSISGKQLRTVSPLDFETGPILHVRLAVTDAGGLRYEKSVTVSVTNVNDVPTALSLTSHTITAGQPAGTIVGALLGSDPDAGDTLSYSLTSGTGSTNNKMFAIVGSQLQTKQVLSAGSYSILVRVKDSKGKTFSQSFSIVVV